MASAVKVDKIVYGVPNDSSKTKSGDPIALPPGTSSEEFVEYIKKAIAIVGEKNVTVIKNKDELSKEDYSDPSKAHDMYHVFDKDFFVASAVIAPRKVTEVQTIMKLCNEYGIPVWPFSVGRNVGIWGRRSTCARKHVRT